MRAICLCSSLLWSFLLSGLLSRPYAANAQTIPDSTRSISYSEEVLSQPLKVDTLALRVQREDQNLWKLGLNNFTPGGGYQRYGLHVAYERKVGSAWSVMGEVSPAWLHYYRYDYNGRYAQSGPSVRAQLAGRYYYNLERRIRQGHNAGNFSANYLSVALGTGIGRYSDTPFGLVVRGGQLVRAEVALLYGVQRRLGRCGFFDVNAGLVRRLNGLVEYQGKMSISGSLRVGLVLGGAPVARPYVPATTDGILTPQWYVGAQAGIYGYALLYNNNISSFNGGTTIGPYVYLGRYLQPRLAVQLGVQYEHQHSTSFYYGTSLDNRLISNQDNVAVPVLLRYALTRLSQQRVQFDMVAGAALVTSWVSYQQLEYVSGQPDPTIVATGRAHGIAINPMLGLNVAYGFGRTRRVQATAEGVLIKPLLSTHYYGLQPGISVGLRYRFHYQ